MKKNYYKELSNFLATIRKTKGYTMSKVSEGTGMSTGYISDIENRLEERLGIPRKANLLKLVNFYNFTESEEKEYEKILLNLLINNYFSDVQIKKIKEKFNLGD